MSSYLSTTKHPTTGRWEIARWLDDYFGRHQYGVEFEDGTIVRPNFQKNYPEISETEKPANPDWGWPEVKEQPNPPVGGDIGKTHSTGLEPRTRFTTRCQIGGCQNCPKQNSTLCRFHCQAEPGCPYFSQPEPRDDELDIEFLPDIFRPIGPDDDVVVSATKVVAWRDAAVARALIEEIEDIDQSRNVEEDAGGLIWCTSCEMSLEESDQECGCNHIYQKREQRIAMLKAQLASLKGAQS